MIVGAPDDGAGPADGDEAKLADSLAALRQRNEELQRRIEQLAERETSYRQLVELAPGGMWKIDDGAVTTFANGRMATMLGYAAEDMIGKSAFEFLDPDDRAMAEEKLERLRRGVSEEFDFRLRRRDGSYLWAHISTTRLTDADGVFQGSFALVTDVTRRHQSEALVAAAEGRFRAAVDGGFDAFVIFECERDEHSRIVDFRFVEVNPAAEREFGGGRGRLIGSPLSEYLLPEHMMVIERYADLVERQASVDEEVLMTGRDGRRHWVRHRAVPLADGLAITTADTTETRELREQIEHQANHDSLTNLPNRMLLDELGEQALARTRRDDKALAVLFVDLDGLKKTNDLVGHDAGDAVLVEVASRFRACLRAGDVLARIGGDEFVVVCEPVRDGDREPHRIAERLIEMLDTPITVKTSSVVVSASIGIALDTARSGNLAALMHQADMAMYEAKQQGGHSAVLNDSDPGDGLAQVLD